MPLLEDEVLPRLWHIMDAGETISRWTRGRAFEDYIASRELRRAIERLFIIIGEALRAALRIDSELAKSISESKQIIAFRHILVHGYAIVNDEFVWATVHDDLPLLLAEVRALLSSNE